MKYNIRISVIVPVYNVEKYLRKCIDSIISQTYTNLEIILVDDGSTDSSGFICDEYSRVDSRIIVVHKENGGLSDARNVGLDIASGIYISFVDSDDWLLKDMYEKLIEGAIKNNVLLSVGGVKVFDEQINKYRNTYEKMEITQMLVSKNEYIKEVLLGTWAAWDKLYHRSLYENIRFPKGEFNEDEAIMLQIIDMCSNVYVTNQPFYVHYVRKNESITAEKFSVKKMDWYKHCESNLEYIRKNIPKLEEEAEYRYFTSIIWCLINMSYNIANFRDESKFLICILKSNIRKILNNKYIIIKEKIRSILMIFNYKLYINLVRIFNKNYFNKKM